MFSKTFTKSYIKTKNILRLLAFYCSSTIFRLVLRAQWPVTLWFHELYDCFLNLPDRLIVYCRLSIVSYVLEILEICFFVGVGSNWWRIVVKGLWLQTDDMLILCRIAKSVMWLDDRVDAFVAIVWRADAIYQQIHHLNLNQRSVND